MERKNTDHISAAKAALGNPQMSDRELGERLGGFSQQSIGHAKAGNMSDHIAVSIGKLLELHQGIDAGIVVLVARAEREKNEEVREVMMRFAGKTLALMTTEKAAAAKLVPAVVGAKKAGLYRAAGVVLAASLVSGAPSPSQANQALSDPNAQTLYIMSTRRRRAAANDPSWKHAA